MKHKGKSYSFVKQRNDDLYAEYKKIVSKRSFLNMGEIANELYTIPAPRFYVSSERAAIVISAMYNGFKLKGMTKNKKEMFIELYKRAKKLKKKMPDLSWTEIAQMLVNQPAPSFYLTPGSAKVLISHAKREWFKQRKEKLKHLFF